MRKKKANLAKLAVYGDIALIVMSCCCLGLLFHVNFVIMVFHGLPFLGSSPAHTLYYYLPAYPYSWSLSAQFWWVTLLTSSFVVLSTWYRSRKLRGKWRLRFLSLLMSSICFGFAALCSSWESVNVENTNYQIELWKEELETEHDTLRKESLSRRIRYGENQLKRLEESKSGKTKK